MPAPRWFLDGRVVVHAGDCREVLRDMADNFVDSVVTDPPYHLTSIVKRFGKTNLSDNNQTGERCRNRSDGMARVAGGFMGKQWDGGDIAFCSELWAEVVRVLKPGGYIMAFSGCRTYHRMACAIEDARFITHPMFAWCFGSGFPKAHSVSKQIDRAAGAERRIVGRANGAATNNTECLGDFRPEYDFTASATDAVREWDGWFYGTQSLKPAVEPIYFGQKPFSEKTGAANVLRWGPGAITVGACKIAAPDGVPKFTYRSEDAQNCYGNGRNGSNRTGEADTTSGRWPANLLHDGSAEVLACFPAVGDSHPPSNEGSIRKNHIYGADNEPRTFHAGFPDSGSAARFFASFPQDAKRIWYGSKADSDDRLGSKHPTVKPLDLIQYLVRLITPKGGVCLDLFAGTGTTGEACFREGFRAILIEREVEYLADIERRMGLVMDGPDTRAYVSAKARNRPRDDGPLFDEAAE
jgi:site-specific DNA-methyltransferase (adenine-specific)